MQRAKIYININKMKELQRFREFLSENALATDKGDGTFEITADIDIMGQKFNFSDICPGAHKAIGDLAKEYANNDVMLGDLLYLANLHQTFFNLEKKALGPQGIDADDLNNIKELYVDINNIANNAFGEEVGKEVKTYMDMHMGKIKEAGLKASEPGGSSDTSYAQDWADEQDAMYGKASFVEEDLSENDKALDEIIDEGKESLTKQIMKKYPKKYKDEKAVKDAAKELMKNPKYKVKQGIGPVLQALLKGK